MGVAHPLRVCVLLHSNSAHDLCLRQGSRGWRNATPASFRATHKNSSILLCARTRTTYALRHRITGMGFAHPCEFSCYAQKLVYLRVREDAHALPCGKDWKGGGAVRERSGRMEREDAEPWKAWFWVAGFLSLAKVPHLPKAARIILILFLFITKSVII